MGNLKQLESKSIYVIRHALAEFRDPAILFSGGKDSLVCLHLIKKASPTGEVEIPVIHIDTSFKFPEMYKFRDRVAKNWDLELVIAKNERALNSGVSPETVGRFKCCMALKTRALQQSIKDHGWDALFVSIRRDESGIRNKERIMSPRDKEFKWKVSEKDNSGDSGFKALQDPEMSGWDLFATDFAGADHIRVHPLLEWTELDVWRYIQQENLAVNQLYFSKAGERYRSLGCMPCTQPIKSNASNINEIIIELEKTKEEERAGRSQDKEKTMHELRALGYL